MNPSNYVEIQMPATCFASGCGGLSNMACRFRPACARQSAASELGYFRCSCYRQSSAIFGQALIFDRFRTNRCLCIFQEHRPRGRSPAKRTAQQSGCMIFRLKAQMKVSVTQPCVPSLLPSGNRHLLYAVDLKEHWW